MTPENATNSPNVDSTARLTKQGLITQSNTATQTMTRHSLFKYLIIITAFILTGCVNTPAQTAASNSAILAKNTDNSTEVMRHVTALANPATGIGARAAGTPQEQLAANYITTQLQIMGYTPQSQLVKHAQPKTGEALHTSNIWVEITGDSSQVIVLGAHFDSTALQTGALGAADNATGIAVMLALANQLQTQSKLPYTVRLIAFGAEEVGKIGSWAYIKQLHQQAGEIDKIIGMINLDTIAGGDNLYIHSAHPKPYLCRINAAKYSASTQMRQALIKASTKVLGKQGHQIHPANATLPAGVVAGWSDHEPFACSGIPIAYLESTNFKINGRTGKDGYSQTTHPKLWDCFDKVNLTACNRKTESQWGQIWHSKHDSIARINQWFPQRLPQQMNANLAVLIEFFTHAQRYLN